MSGVNSRSLCFNQKCENNSKSPCAKEKCDSLALSRSDLWLIWRCHGIPRVYCYYFYLEPAVRKGHLDENGFRYCYGNFSKGAFWKLLDHSYVESPFSTNTRHIDNSILKDTLQFFILRTWINMRAKSFIKTLGNVNETRIKEGTQKVHLEEHCTKIETMFHLFYAFLFLTNFFKRFFFSQTVFKFNIVLIGIFFFFLIMSTTIYFFAFWLTFISLIFKFIQCFTLL